MTSELKHEQGPFDIIGDVHGCFDELVELLTSLGYTIAHGEKYQVTPPLKRKVIFLGDLVDRGPNSPEVLTLVMDMVDAGIALCVPGNHDIKLMKKLLGRDVTIAHGMQESLDQLADKPPEFIQRVINFFSHMAHHYVLDNGNLVVAHAGMKESYQGRHSSATKAFALFGQTTNELDEHGLPIRYDWAKDYQGKATVVYGHTPNPKSEWLNNTINIDNGCVFGGKLTGLKYPEKELVSVSAKQMYAKPLRPFLLSSSTC